MEKTKKVGRPSKDNVKVGVAISPEAKKIMDTLAEATGKTKSNIVEEALDIMKRNADTITARVKRFEHLKDEDLLNLEEYVKNREARENATLLNAKDIVA